MQGYFVVTKDADDEESKKLKATLEASQFVNLQCTRTFNRLTHNEFKKQASSAVTHLRNKQDESKEKRKAYHQREDVKKRTKEYNKLPEVKERKRLERQRKKKLLALVPKEAIVQVYKEEFSTNTQ